MNDDLSVLDRSTLRAWRAMNLIGWGAAATGADLAVMVAYAFAYRFAVNTTNPAPPWLGIPSVVVVLVLAGAAAGAAVGGHVYRWPGIVAGLGTGWLGVGFVLFITPLGDPTMFLIGLSFASINVASAVLVARRRWRSRPRALRALSG